MHTHTTQTKQVGVFPCRGLVAPCQRAAGSIKNCRFAVKRGEAGKRRSRRGSLLGWSREWWAHLVAHFEFTRINTTPTFHDKKIEDAV